MNENYNKGHVHLKSKPYGPTIAQWFTSDSQTGLYFSENNCILIIGHNHYEYHLITGYLQVLGKFGCPNNVIRLINELHNSNRAEALPKGGVRDPFSLRCGVRQGYMLAAALFIVFIGAVLHVVNSKLKDRTMLLKY